MTREFLQVDNLPIKFPTSITPDVDGAAGPLDDGDSFTFTNTTTIPETNTVYIYDTTNGTWTGSTEGGGSGSNGNIITQCDEPDLTSNPSLTEGTIWIKVCYEADGVTPICPHEMYLWCTDGAGNGTWNPIEGGSGGGGGNISNPDKNLISSDPPLAGLGTQSDPFIIAPATCFKKGSVDSDNEITFINLIENDFVVFSDENSAVNGGSFDQGIGVVGPSGTYTFRLKFTDRNEIGGQVYTADLKCGDIYFRWVVSVLDKGIDPPLITKVLDQSGKLVDAPLEPNYPTNSNVSSAVPSTTLTNLTDGTSSELTSVGGSGNGLIMIVTALNGTWKSTTIVNAGSGYVFGETVTVDLSSLGGSSTQEMVVHTSPVTTSSTVIQTNGFVSDNAGNFDSVEWQFSDSEDFSGIITTETTTVEPKLDNTISAKNSRNDGDVYYFRIRYVSDDGTVSSWSKIVRVARGSTVRFAYRITNLRGGANKGFQSGNGYVTPIAHTYLSATLNFKSDGTRFHYETDRNDIIGAVGGRGGGGKQGQVAGDNMYGYPAKAMIYLQIRQPVRMVVDTDDGSGKPVTMSMHPDYTNSIGLPDFITEGAEVEPTSNIIGGGTGLKLRFQKDTDGTTKFASFDTTSASGYNAGDVIEFVPPIGDGSPKSVDSMWDTLVHGIAGTARGNGAGDIPTYFTHDSNNKNGGTCWTPEKRPANPTLMYSESSTSNGQTGGSCDGSDGSFATSYGGGAGFPGGPGNKNTVVNAGSSQGGSYGATVFNSDILPEAYEEIVSVYDGIYLYTDYGTITFKQVLTKSDYIRIF